jgi:hypothetical protein
MINAEEVGTASDDCLVFRGCRFRISDNGYHYVFLGFSQSLHTTVGYYLKLAKVD